MKSNLENILSILENYSKTIKESRYKASIDSSTSRAVVYDGKRVIKQFSDLEKAKRFADQNNAVHMHLTIESNDPSQREMGTDSLVKIYSKDTPFQNLDWKSFIKKKFKKN